jgi:hypothetical protein
MNLLKENTQIFFIITSEGILLQRFADDFINAGLVSLNKIGFPEGNITVVSDTSVDDLQNKYGFPPTLHFIDSSKLLSSIGDIDCDNLMIVSSCHGNSRIEYGFDSKTKIQPFPFLSAIKNNQHIKNTLVMFGQCYCGIFNYSQVECDDKSIVYMGAAGMNESSSVSGLTILGKKINWMVNIAVWAFFEWLSNPIDVDGDNRTTAMDLYKYISYVVLKTNDLIEHHSYAVWLQKHKLHDEKMEKADKTDTALLKSLNDELSKINTEYVLPRQLPWILNPVGALNMSIEY